MMNSITSRKSPFAALVVFTAIFLSACSPSGGNDSGTSYTEAKSSGAASLRVLYVEADGFAYHDENNELTGVTVEIMRDFVRWFERYHAVNVELEFVAETNWQTFYQRIVSADGGVFGLGNVTITEARKEELQFSPAYLNNVAVLITNNEVTELEGWDDIARNFADLKPMAFSGTLHEVRVTELRDRFQPSLPIAQATSNPEIINAVASEGYYSYIDAYNYWRAVDSGISLMHHAIADDFGETFGIIMPHNNDWATMLTAFFAAEGGYRNTQAYRDIMETHLGKALTATLEAARTNN